jgi:hypothetical protein
MPVAAMIRFVRVDVLRDLTEDDACLVARLLGGKDTMLADGHAHRPIVELALGDVDLALGADAQAETLQLGITIECLAACRKRNAIDDPLGKPVSHIATSQMAL